MSRQHKITTADYHVACETIHNLAELLLEIGIVELKISKADMTIFWDTEGKGQIDPEALESFSTLIEQYYEGRLAVKVRAR